MGLAICMQLWNSGSMSQACELAGTVAGPVTGGLVDSTRYGRTSQLLIRTSPVSQGSRAASRLANRSKSSAVPR